MISTEQLIRLGKSINTALAATVFALMARTLGTGDLATGSYGDRHLATGRLAHDWQFTEGYSGLRIHLRIIRKYKRFSIVPRARIQSSIGSEGSGTHGYLALWHLVAGTWQLAA